MNVPVETNTMLINYQRKWETRQIKKLHRQTMHDMSSFTNGWCPKLSSACVAAFYGHKKMLKLVAHNMPPNGNNHVNNKFKSAQNLSK